MARIPIASDVAQLIGPAAEKVENRSLLLDKFVFHKRWPVEIDERGREVKWDDASRWSFMRIAEGASQLLNKDAQAKRYRAEGANVEPENRDRMLAEAQLAESLARVSWDSKEISILRTRHTRRFLGLFRNAFAGRASITIAQSEARLAVNLADSLIQNAGICLDRLFGLPFVPGSAVKGVCRHAALHELKSAGEECQRDRFDTFRSVFGTADNDFTHGELRPFRHLLSDRSENQRGAVAFLPAYPVNEARIVVDLTNVHYPEYYRTGRTEDLSKERPQPNPFPVVETGARFAFCLVLLGSTGDPLHLQAAVRWLETALTVQGLGAKTASGYGWFSLRPDVLQQLLDEERHEAETMAAKAKVEAEARAKTEADAARRAAMSPEELARERFAAMSQQDFAAAASGIGTLSATDQKGLMLALLMSGRRDTWKSWKKSDKPANKARIVALSAIAKALGMSLP
jgi:CRISPR type III-B/RAMP module RAMP protein Cmr6